MNATSIGWTDFTSNPIRYRDANGEMVWGCERLSPACAHCYAAELARRYGRGAGEFTKEEMAAYTPYFDEPEARKILTAQTIKGKPVSGSKCFIGDMTDVFGEWVPDELLDRLFAVMALRQDVTFQVLTKRPDRMLAYMSNVEREAYWMNGTARALQAFNLMDTRPAILARREPWLPLPNVWLGTSVENQHWADIRIPLLLQTPAAVRFLSIEPLLGPIDFGSPELRRNHYGHRIDWGILGCESGLELRDPGLPAIVGVARQFERAGVPLFVKQDVHRRPGQQGRIPDDIWALKQFPREMPRVSA